MPLFGLTLWTAIGLLADDEPVPAPPLAPASALEEAKGVAAKGAKRAESESPAVQEIAAAEPFALDPAAFHAAQAPPFQEIAQTYRGSQCAARLTDKVRATGILSPAPLSLQAKEDVERVTRQRDALRKFVREESGSDEKAPQSAALLAWLSTESDQCDQVLKVLDSIREAHQAWLAKNPVEAIERLRRISVTEIEDASIRRRLEEGIEKKLGLCQFLVDAEKLPPDPPEWDPAVLDDVTRPIGELRRDLGIAITADRQMVERLDGFLKRYGEMEGQARYAEIRSRWERLVAKTTTLESVNTAMAAISELDKEPNLASLSSKVASRLAEIEANAEIGPRGAIALKRRIQEGIARWLLMVAFPRKDPPAILANGNEEAITSNNQRLIGQFELRKNALLYRFWRWDGPKDHQQHPDGEQLVGDCEERPSRPKYVEWADRYNTLRLSLFRGASGAQWAAFFAECRKLENDFRRYQERRGKDKEPDRSCSAWSFLPDPAVLPHGSDEDLAGRLAKLQQMKPPRH